jgi:DNA-binding response OmpR family regulator
MANYSDASSTTLRFGPFEVNLNARQLFKNGSRIRLQEQPFEILATLLSQTSEMALGAGLAPGGIPGQQDQRNPGYPERGR